MATAPVCQMTERLLDLLLGDDAESRHMEAHLENCEACRQEWESLIGGVVVGGGNRRRIRQLPLRPRM